MRLTKFVLIFLAAIFVFCGFLFAVTYHLLPKLQQDVAILVLGKGGEGHTAPNLTDTIMFVHLNFESNKVNILSLPRDTWIPAIRAKLNTAYHYGGFEMAAESVFGITGIKPDHYIVLDFSIFKDLIDSIGGINVLVDNSFVDEWYPIEGLENDLCNGDKLYKCRYETLQFSEGLQHMDGETALKFVRSRNAIGAEGTDLAREKRQQKVVEAIKNNLFKNKVLLNPKKLKGLFDTIVSHIETDVDSRTMLELARFGFESKDNISFLSMPEDFIKVSQNDKKYDFQYVFVPASGTWNEFQEWISKSI